MGNWTEGRALAYLRSSLADLGASDAFKAFERIQCLLYHESLQIVPCGTLNSDQLGHFNQAGSSYIYAYVIRHCHTQASDSLPVNRSECSVRGLYSHF